MKRFLAVILGLAMVLGFAATASAATGIELYFGGEFQVGVQGDSGSLSDDDEYGTFAGWFVLDVSVNKDLGPKSSAWITLDVQPFNYPAQGGGYQLYHNQPIDVDQDDVPDDPDDDQVFVLDLNPRLLWGYTYKFSDKVSVTFGDFDGVMRSDGILGGEAGDGWGPDDLPDSGGADWNKLFNEPGNGLTVKLDATPMEGLVVQALYEPLEAEYLVKASYTGEGFKIGGDITNETYAFANWDLWGEVMIMDGLKVTVDVVDYDYGGLIDLGYLVMAEYTVDPIKAKVQYSNLVGDYWSYLPNTLEGSLLYALTDNLSIGGGLAYNVAGGSLDKYWAQVVFGKLDVKVTNWAGPGWGIDLYAKYKIDDTNTLDFWYNFTYSGWSITYCAYLY